MADITKKQFLDYEGLVEVFKLVKTEDEKLQAAITILQEQVGEWTVEDMETIAKAIASLQEILDNLDTDDIKASKTVQAYGSTLTEIINNIKSEIEAKTFSIENGDGINITKDADPNKNTFIISAKVKANDEFLTMGSEGIGTEGINTAISTAVNSAKDELKGSATTDGDTLGKLENKIKGLKDLVGEDTVGKQIEDALDELDFTGTNSGAVITQVTQENGKVSATAANITSNDETVTVNGLDLAVNIDGTTIVKGTNGKLGVASSALTQYIGKEAVTVSTVDDEKNEKTISLKIASGDKVLTQSDAGLLANLELKYTKATDGTNGKIELIGKNNTVISTFDTTDFTVDGFLDSVAWSQETGKKDILVFTWNTVAGKTATEVDLSKYIDTYLAGNGLALDSDTKTFSVKKDTTSEGFLTVSENGVKVSGIQDAINTATESCVKYSDAMTIADVQAAYNSVFKSQTTTPTDPTD